MSSHKLDLAANGGIYFTVTLVLTVPISTNLKIIRVGADFFCKN